MIAFAGDRSFPQTVSALAEKLSDVGWLVRTLPDVQVTETTAERAAWRMKPKLAFIAGHLDTIMERTEHRPGEAVGFRVVTKAIGASSTVNVRLAFHDAPGGTRVVWTGELAEVTGLLRMVPKGLLQATAEKVIEDVWAAVAARLG